MERKNRIYRMVKNQKNKGKSRLIKNTDPDAKGNENSLNAMSKRKTKENSPVQNSQHREDVNSKSEEATNEYASKFDEFALTRKYRKQKQNEKDKKLVRQKEKERMKNQRIYGYLMMSITVVWGIFVGYIILSTSYTLAENKAILDNWILNALIASLIGMLFVVLRIVFPSRKSTKRRGISVRKRKNKK